jgi:glycosyltransferase involved in cell wall biosynthesis
MITTLRQNGHEVHIIITGIPRPGIRSNALKHVDYVHLYYKNNLRNFIRIINSLVDFLLKLIRWPPTEDIVSRVLKRKFQYIFLDYWQRYPAGLDAYTDKIISRYQLDAVIVEYIWLWPVIRLIPQNITTILDTHDIQYMRCEEFQKIGKSFPLRINREIESKIFNLFDAIIAIQKKDYDLIKEMSTSKIILAGATGNFNQKQQLEPLSCSRENKEIKILFIGGYNEANIHGLNKFIDHVWRSVVKKHDNIRLEVVGYIYRSLREINDLKELKVDLHGFVENTSLFYQRADIAINPVWIGTGLKIKTVESLNHGIPLITTSKGVEGLPATINSACIITDDPSVMIDKLSLLISSAEERGNLIKESNTFKSKYLSMQIVYQELLDFIND